MRKALLLAGLSMMAVLVFASMALAQSEDEFDCADFDSREEAQAALDRDTDDPNNLDADNNGLACETFPYDDDGGDDNGTPTDDQYNGSTNGDGDDGGVDDSDRIISDTISKKPLPNTGGVPLLGLAVGALALVAVGFSVLGTSVRRDP